MVINSKNKGSAFERDLVKLLNDKLESGSFKRIPGSGAIGTQMSESLLTGDVTGRVLGMNKPFKIECKVGYGGETQLTLKREWLTKIVREAETNYAVPVLIGKFSGARKTEGVQSFAVLDLDTFVLILNTISKLQRQLDDSYEVIHDKSDGVE